MPAVEAIFGFDGWHVPNKVSACDSRSQVAHRQPSIFRAISVRLKLRNRGAREACQPAKAHAAIRD